MSIEFARVIIFLALSYGVIGLLVAPVMIFWRIGRIDASAAESTRGFRAIVLPGAVLLWPILLRRFWVARGVPPVESNSHRRQTEVVAPERVES
jgi:hypothetical protein